MTVKSCPFCSTPPAHRASTGPQMSPLCTGARSHMKQEINTDQIVTFCAHAGVMTQNNRGLLLKSSTTVTVSDYIYCTQVQQSGMLFSSCHYQNQLTTRSVNTDTQTQQKHEPAEATCHHVR